LRVKVKMVQKWSLDEKRFRREKTESIERRMGMKKKVGPKKEGVIPDRGKESTL